MEDPKERKNAEIYLKIAIAVLAFFLIFLCAMFVREYRRLAILDYRINYNLWFQSLHAREPATVADVPFIEPWMTFDYLNKIFSLPPPFLQTDLGITDPRYPRLTIARFAKDQHATSTGAVVSEVENSIRTYISQKR